MRHRDFDKLLNLEGLGYGVIQREIVNEKLKISATNWWYKNTIAPEKDTSNTPSFSKKSPTNKAALFCAKVGKFCRGREHAAMALALEISVISKPLLAFTQRLRSSTWPAYSTAIHRSDPFDPLFLTIPCSTILHDLGMSRTEIKVLSRHASYEILVKHYLKVTPDVEGVLGATLKQKKEAMNVA